MLIRLVLVLLLMQRALAAPILDVLSVGNGQAMIKIDGRMQVLRVGQSYAGLTLRAADGQSLQLESANFIYHYDRERGLRREPVAREPAAVEIRQQAGGVYVAAGAINGANVNFVVDTGASVVTLSADLAGTLGIDFRNQGQLAQVTTAAQVMQAYRITLPEVRVGAIALQQVPAVVLKGAMPHLPLLGMSFLSRVRLEHHGQALILRALR